MPIEGSRRDELRHDTNVAAPLGIGVVDRHLDVDVEALAPLLDLVTIEYVSRDCGCPAG